MNYENNFDLFQLFITKDIKVWPEGSPQDYFIIKAPTIKDFYLKENLNMIINLLNSNSKELKEFNPLLKGEVSFLILLNSIFFDLSMYKEFWSFTKSLKSGLEELIPSIIIDKTNKKIFVKEGLELTDDNCNSIQKVIKLICGDNRETVKPTSKESSDFYEAQKEQEAKIAALRRKTNSEKNKDGLLKTFLFIEYKFPSYTHEYLLNQTMAQIQWLQKYAAGAVSYEVNAEVFAAGNMKKGSKLDFFIK
jgi:hypothetical protein